MIGLTTAVLLSKDSRYSVTVIAKHMPGDYDIEYASPWAGANYLPYVCDMLSVPGGMMCSSFPAPVQKALHSSNSNETLGLT